MNLTKSDVSRRQLVTAIRLFFNEGDPVSVYTLASNALEVIDQLCKLRRVESVSDQTRTHIDDSKDLPESVTLMGWQFVFV
jgi:urocanate hydratase